MPLVHIPTSQFIFESMIPWSERKLVRGLKVSLWPEGRKEGCFWIFRHSLTTLLKRMWVEELSFCNFKDLRSKRKVCFFTFRFCPMNCLKCWCVPLAGLPWRDNIITLPSSFVLFFCSFSPPPQAISTARERCG